MTGHIMSVWVSQKAYRLTIGKSIQYTSEEPFAFLAHELDVFVGRAFTARLEFSIGDREEALSFCVPQRDMYVPGADISHTFLI